MTPSPELSDRPAPPRKPGLRAVLGRLALGGVLVAGSAASLAACGTVDGHGSGSGTSGTAPGESSSERSVQVSVTVPTQALRAALGCPKDIAVAVDQRLDVPTTHRAAVLAAHCDSAAGSPPTGVYLVASVGSGSRIAATLLPASAQVEVRTLTGSRTTVRVAGLGYSAPTVPRCCPDVTVAQTWTVRGDRLVPGS